MRATVLIQELMNDEQIDSTNYRAWSSREDTHVERPIKSVINQFRNQLDARDIEIVSLKDNLSEARNLIMTLMEKYDFSHDSMLEEQLFKFLLFKF